MCLECLFAWFQGFLFSIPSLNSKLYLISHILGIWNLQVTTENPFWPFIPPFLKLPTFHPAFSETSYFSFRLFWNFLLFIPPFLKLPTFHPAFSETSYFSSRLFWNFLLFIPPFLEVNLMLERLPILCVVCTIVRIIRIHIKLLAFCKEACKNNHKFAQGVQIFIVKIATILLWQPKPTFSEPKQMFLMFLTSNKFRYELIFFCYFLS